MSANDNFIHPNEIDQIVKARAQDMMDDILDELEERIYPSFNDEIIDLEKQLTIEAYTVYQQIDSLVILSCRALAEAAFKAGYMVAQQPFGHPINYFDYYPANPEAPHPLETTGFAE